MARKEELARKWERTLNYLYNQRPAFEREGASGYKPGLETSIALDKKYKEPHRHYRTMLRSEAMKSEKFSKPN